MLNVVRNIKVTNEYVDYKQKNPKRLSSLDKTLRIFFCIPVIH